MSNTNSPTDSPTEMVMTIKEASTLLNDALAKQQAHKYWLVAIGVAKDAGVDAIIVYLLDTDIMKNRHQVEILDLAENLNITFPIVFRESKRPSTF